MFEQSRCDRNLFGYLFLSWNEDCLYRLTNFHQLRRTSFRMGLQLPALRPAIRVIMVVNVTEQEACICFMNDQADITANSNRPKIRISRLTEFVKLHSGIRRIYLQVEGRGFHGFLLLAHQSPKAIRERASNAEFHNP